MATSLQTIPTRPIPISVKNKFFSMTEASLAILGRDRRSELHHDVCSADITECGCGWVEILSYLLPDKIAFNENDVVLTLPLHPEKSLAQAYRTLEDKENSFHLFRVEEYLSGVLLFSETVEEEGVHLVSEGTIAEHPGVSPETYREARRKKLKNKKRKEFLRMDWAGFGDERKKIRAGRRTDTMLYFRLSTIAYEDARHTLADITDEMIPGPYPADQFVPALYDRLGGHPAFEFLNRIELRSDSEGNVHPDVLRKIAFMLKALVGLKKRVGKADRARFADIPGFVKFLALPRTESDQAAIGNMLDFMREVGIIPSGVKAKITNTRANFIQGLLKSWLRLPLLRVPQTQRTGVYQKVGESLNSLFSLHYEKDAAGKQAGLPNTRERRPEVRAEIYRNALDIVCRRTEPFEYATARELKPQDYKPGNRRGNRRVRISEDWLRYIEKPFPGRFPGFFVNQAGKSPVSVYEHREGRLYAFLPILTADEGPLVPQPGGELDWWHPLRSEFKPLSLFERSWPASGTGIMVPLDCDSNSHQPDQQKIMNVESHIQFRRDERPNGINQGMSEFAKLRRELKHRRSHEFRPKMLEGPLRHQGDIEQLLRSGMGIGTVLLKEYRSSHPNRKENTGPHRQRKKLRGSGVPTREWKLQFALRYENKVPLYTRTMGVHLEVSDRPIVYWHIHETDIHGSFDWFAQINKALARQAELENDQRRSRSTANHGFSKENRAWIRNVARQVVLKAKNYGCSLARVKVKFVPEKRSGSPAISRQFSMSFYSDLGSEIDHQANKAAVFHLEVSDYEGRYTDLETGVLAKAKPGEPPLNTDPAICVKVCAMIGARKVNEMIQRIKLRTETYEMRERILAIVEEERKRQMASEFIVVRILELMETLAEQKLLVDLSVEVRGVLEKLEAFAHDRSESALSALREVVAELLVKIQSKQKKPKRPKLLKQIK
jgi:hypothetical protein